MIVSINQTTLIKIYNHANLTKYFHKSDQYAINDHFNTTYRNRHTAAATKSTLPVTFVLCIMQILHVNYITSKDIRHWRNQQIDAAKFLLLEELRYKVHKLSTGN
jgi:hypothetical protein